MEKICAIIATFLGVGKAPKAPGTFGTLAAIPLALLLMWLGPFYTIGYLDKKVPGGFGVMADDIAAGIIANILLQIVLTKTAWLGVQIV